MPQNVITINVKPAGNSCNIRCAYCDINHSFKEESFNILSYLSEIKKIKYSYDFIHIVLHGGEPLLAPLDLLEKIIVLTRKELSEKCDFQIQTNGLCLTDEAFSFLTTNTCKLSISLDPPNNNLRYNEGKYSDVKRNVCQAILAGCTPGILSVAHSGNYPFFLDFMEALSNMGIQYWTINKIRVDSQSQFFLSETTYLELLLQIMKKWIEGGFFETLSIQPLIDLLSPEENHSCRFSSDVQKCTCFAVFSGQKLVNHCEHYSNEFQSILEKCKICDIFDLCGGGCPAEQHDEDFCNSRQFFFSSLQQLKHQIGVF